MEGSQSGQSDTTGDPFDDPVKDLSSTPSNNRTGGDTKADSTNGNDGDRGQSRQLDSADEPVNDAPNPFNENEYIEADFDTSGDISGDSSGDTIANGHERNDPKSDARDGNQDDTETDSDEDAGGDSNNDTSGDNEANDNGESNGDTDDSADNDAIPGTDGPAKGGSTNIKTQDIPQTREGQGRTSEVTIVTQGGSSPLEPSNVTTVCIRDAEKELVGEESDRRELKPEDCEDELGYAFPKWKKWWILTVIFLIQTSMNFNTSLYSSGIPGIAEEFEVADWAARLGAAIFLVSYAFGCELWAPWSEEFGRRPVLQLSLFLTNIWALPVVFAPSLASVLIGRFLGGLSTAGGSVTLGMIPDLYDSDRQQYAVAYIVFSSVGGSVLGPIIGGFLETLDSQVAWRWCIWVQIIFGVFVQLLHLFTVPETRTTIMLDTIAKNRRASHKDVYIYGPGELCPLRDRFSWKELWDTWKRPFHMLLREPIVTCLSLLSGFSDAIIFVQIQALGLVYEQWGFNSWQRGLAFTPIAIGYFIGWMLFIPAFWLTQRKRERNPNDQWAQYESRLYLMLFLAPLLPAGLLIFGWTSQGPPVHWIYSMIGTTLIGISNYAIYMGTIDYMVCAYGPYSASATGGNGFARDILAGILTIPAVPFYKRFGGPEHSFQWASSLLGFVSIGLVIAAFIVYWTGPALRKRSPFAQHLALREEEFEGHPISVAPRPASVLIAEIPEAVEPIGGTGATGATGATEAPEITTTSARAMSIPGVDVDVERAIPSLTVRPAFGPESPRGSYLSSVQATSRRQSRQASRNASANPSRRTSSEAPHEHLAGSLGDRLGESLAARLQGLTTIDAVVDES
ncbi:MFS general substrate transporter [Xylaria nigripes]|nr:MFS general substrate transporter [Xylaria nigripes]